MLRSTCLVLTGLMTILAAGCQPGDCRHGDCKKAQTRTPGVNVRDFGAVGDGRADDTAALQAAIDAACPIGGGALAIVPSKVVLPAGHYRITKPLKSAPGQKTLLLQGTGGVDCFGGSPASNPKRVPRAATQIIYDGPEGQPLLDIRGMGGLQIRNLGLIGNGQCGTLLRINAPKGFGAGRYHIENVVFAEADTAISCGDDSYINSADMTFVSILVQRVKTGFVTHSGQNIDYCFIRPHFTFTDTCFRFEAGGNCQATMPTMVNCRRAVQIDSAGWNTGSFHFDTLHMETARKTAYQILKARGQCTVTFTALSAQTQYAARKAGDTTPLFDIGPSVMVRVQGGQISNGPVAVMRGAARQPAWIGFENCRFFAKQPYNGDPRTTIATDDFSGYRVTDSIVTLEDPSKQRGTEEDSIFITEFSRVPEGVRTEK